MILKEHQYIAIGQAAKLLGLSVPTLRRYEKQGKIIPKFRTFGNHRRYCIFHLRNINQPQNNKTICYARVSSHDQKKDLLTQKAKLKHYCQQNNIQNFEMIDDLGSGINFKKKVFENYLMKS